MKIEEIAMVLFLAFIILFGFYLHYIETLNEKHLPVSVKYNYTRYDLAKMNITKNISVS